MTPSFLFLAPTLHLSYLHLLLGVALWSAEQSKPKVDNGEKKGRRGREDEEEEWVTRRGKMPIIAEH